MDDDPPTEYADPAPRERRDAYQRRLLEFEQRLVAAGLELDDLIELIEARQNGRY